MTAEQDLRNFTNLSTRGQALLGQRDFIQARYTSTIYTDKVRMGGMGMLAFTDGFDTPHMIAQFRSAEQAGIGHIIQVAIGGGFVDAPFG